MGGGGRWKGRKEGGRGGEREWGEGGEEESI